MKQQKLIAAIVIVAGLLIWPVGWQLYSYLPELKQFTPTEYQNYLVIAILGTYIAAALGVTSRRTLRELPARQKHVHHGNPPSQNTTNIDELAVDVALLKERMKQVETKVTGLQTFFKQSKEEEKPSV
jgi:hypothetical protein